MKKIKLGIDLTYIREDKVSGIKKYAEEILEGISKCNKDYEIVLFIDKELEKSYEEKFPEYKKVIVKALFKKIKYVRGIYNRTIDKKYKEYIIKKQKCDIVFYPYTDVVTPINNDINSIAAILDIIPLDIIKDKNSKKYKKYKKRYIKLMNKSKNITTLSEYSKNRLLDINTNYTGRIEVIPSSVDKLEKTNRSAKEIIKTDSKYIFSINSFCKHKNQITLVKAFNMIKDKITHDLVLVGRPELGSPISGYNEVINYINKEKLNDRVKILSYISDEERNALFYNTDLFVTTSMQEGFGRTPVEAGMCKVPVISTRETSLPEATMNMVYYYENPTDEIELANKMIEVLNNKPSEERLINIADKFEKEYNIEVIVQKYIDFIEKAVNNK